MRLGLLIALACALLSAAIPAPASGQFLDLGERADPDAEFTWPPEEPPVDQTVTFTRTSDAGGEGVRCKSPWIIGRSWDLDGDGETDAYETATWTYRSAGFVRVTHEVTVECGNTGTHKTGTRSKLIEINLADDGAFPISHFLNP